MYMQRGTKILMFGVALGGLAVWVYLNNKRKKPYRDPEKIVGTDVTYLYPAIYPVPYPYFGKVMYPQQPPQQPPKNVKNDPKG